MSENQFTTPQAREIFRATGNLLRAQAAERYNLRLLEEESIATAERINRDAARIREEQEAKNPKLLKERAEAEEKAKTDELARLQAAQRAKQEADAQAIRDNRERARLAALAADGRTPDGRLKPQSPVQSTSTQPKPPTTIPKPCPYCFVNLNEHEHRSWCQLQ